MEKSAQQIAARKEIDRICSIYRTVGAAMHEEARDRMALAVAAAVMSVSLKDHR